MLRVVDRRFCRKPIQHEEGCPAFLLGSQQRNSLVGFVLRSHNEACSQAVERRVERSPVDSITIQHIGDCFEIRL